MNRPHTVQDWLDIADACARQAYRSQLTHLVLWEGAVEVWQTPPDTMDGLRANAKVFGAVAAKAVGR